MHADSKPVPPPTYVQIRECSKNLHSKMVKRLSELGYDFLRVAKAMTLPTAGRTLIFGGETDMNAFMDFQAHEYRLNGKTLMEHCVPECMELSPLEMEIARAVQQSRTSLFETIGVAPPAHQIQLQDLLEPEQPVVSLTDLGLSSSINRFHRRPLLFMRVITVHGISMTSGFSFLFEPALKNRLLQSYRQKMKKIPPSELPIKKFVFFFRKNTELGEEQAYQTVTPHGVSPNLLP